MKDPDESGPDGITIKDRMQSLIESIAKSIQECGSACDAYLKKSFLCEYDQIVYVSQLTTNPSANIKKQNIREPTRNLGVKFCRLSIGTRASFGCPYRTWS
jgi:hypothetical protein